MSRQIIWRATALLITTSILSVARAAERDEEKKISFNVQPGGTLRVDADVADVTITTRDSRTVDVTSTRRLKVADPEEAERLLKRLSISTTQSGNDVNITVRFDDDKRGNDRNKIDLEFEIAMPREFNVALRTGGSASIGDIHGRVEAAVGGGSLKLGNVSGAVVAKVGGGRITVGDVGGGLEARSGGGSVKAGRVTGPVIARAAGGSVLIAEVTGAIEAAAVGGSIKAYISKQPQTASRLTAEGGGVDLRLPGSVAVTVDASCSAGQIASDYEVLTREGARGETLKGTINGGGPTITIRAAAGNIRLRKDSHSDRSAAVRIQQIPNAHRTAAN